MVGGAHALACAGCCLAAVNSLAAGAGIRVWCGAQSVPSACHTGQPAASIGLQQLLKLGAGVEAQLHRSQVLGAAAYCLLSLCHADGEVLAPVGGLRATIHTP